jgi:hypothetical protein|eukprot:COSAG06_NODE_7_length_38054_cov_37.302569_19_plen_49_part_00
MDLIRMIEKLPRDGWLLTLLTLGSAAWLMAPATRFAPQRMARGPPLGI